MSGVIEPHSIRDMSWQSSNDAKRRELAAHLNSGYHAKVYPGATLRYLQQKHREAHAK